MSGSGAGLGAEGTVRKRQSPTDWARRRFKGVLDPAGAFFIRLGLTPNTMTFLGLAGNIAAGVALSQGLMTLGGLLILIAAPFDALDGTMARLMGQPTKFGGFVDSVTDRWSEMFIFLGLLYFYLQRGDSLACILVFAAVMGSVMVSYTKARAEALGFDCNVGILTRLERFIVLGPALLLNLPWVALWVIAVLANVTAVQRALYVRRQALQARPNP
ncbi:MAG: CDP-alcohol phosphatidyltransferase family protein [Anaerolineales bacterium]